MKEINILYEQKADLFNITVTPGHKSLREQGKICHRVKGTKTTFYNKMNPSCHSMYI